MKGLSKTQKFWVRFALDNYMQYSERADDAFILSKLIQNIKQYDET